MESALSFVHLMAVLVTIRTRACSTFNVMIKLGIGKVQETQSELPRASGV